MSEDFVWFLLVVLVIAMAFLGYYAMKRTCWNCWKDFMVWESKMSDNCPHCDTALKSEQLK